MRKPGVDFAMPAAASNRAPVTTAICLLQQHPSNSDSELFGACGDGCGDHSHCLRERFVHLLALFGFKGASRVTLNMPRQWDLLNGPIAVTSTA